MDRDADDAAHAVAHAAEAVLRNPDAVPAWQDLITAVNAYRVATHAGPGQLDLLEGDPWLVRWRDRAAAGTGLVRVGDLLDAADAATTLTRVQGPEGSRSDGSDGPSSSV